MAINTYSKLWIEANPEQGGPGDHIVNVSVDKHTGRGARNVTLTWNADFVEPVDRTVFQEGEVEFAKFEQTIYSANKVGQILTIRGKSNSKNLLFSFSQSHGAEIDANYKAATINTGNGEAILGDPGYHQEFNFEITVDIPANNTESNVSRILNVYGAPEMQSGGRPVRPSKPLAYCTINSNHIDNYLIVDSDNIKIPASGGVSTIKVDSNTNWKISIKSLTV